MGSLRTNLVVALILALGAGAVAAGEDPLVAKVDCPKCAPDGKVPSGDREAGSMMLNDRPIATPYCPNCKGSGWLLRLPDGKESPAATADQIEAFDLRTKVVNLAAAIKRDEEILARQRDELAKAQAKLKALEAKAKPAK